jgi:hypothetical protein
MSTPDIAATNLAEALAECEKLRAENQRLREQLGISPVETPVSVPPERAVVATQGMVNAKSSPDEKVKLFRRLFRGRDDV